MYRNYNKCLCVFVCVFTNFQNYELVSSWLAQGGQWDGECVGAWITKLAATCSEMSAEDMQLLGQRQRTFIQHTAWASCENEFLLSPKSPGWMLYVHWDFMGAETHWTLRLKCSLCPGGRHYPALGTRLLSANITLKKGLGLRDFPGLGTCCGSFCG